MGNLDYVSEKIYARQNIRICGVKSTFHKFVIRNEKE